MTTIDLKIGFPFKWQIVLKCTSHHILVINLKILANGLGFLEMA